MAGLCRTAKPDRRLCIVGRQRTALDIKVADKRRRVQRPQVVDELPVLSRPGYLLLHRVPFIAVVGHHAPQMLAIGDNLFCSKNPFQLDVTVALKPRPTALVAETRSVTRAPLVATRITPDPPQERTRAAYSSMPVSTRA